MAKLKENSTILKHTGEEIIATEESVDRKLLTKANKTELPTKLSQLTKDIDFDERYYTETEVNTKLDGKVDNSRVLTNVPINAKFTDTITSINGKTGVITKADIVALGIPAQDTNTTYSEISTAEIDAGTSSTLRTITGRRVKYILDKVQGWIDSITKVDIGLGDVDNVKQASKTEFDNHVNNTSNPHSVTKSQVGLGNVQNYGIATQAEAEAGTVNNKYMTPLRTRQAIENVLGTIEKGTKIVTGPTEPIGLTTGDQWHREY